MEILSIYISQKNGSIIDLYPCEYNQVDFDLSIYQNFLTWAISNADASGKIALEMSAYDTIMELTEWDDIPCPLALVINYMSGQDSFSISVPYDRKSSIAYLSTNKLV
ncbi:MAG: hypothetical protein PHY48_11770 [Candidatus Cloacimonetes bacterium]|nr:hypothetical protein [Candidatus Cloacimonadota bacterium]